MLTICPNEKYKHCEQFRDCCLQIKKYEKNKSFNQMRCDLYTESLMEKNLSERLEMYTRQRNSIKDLNRQLHLNFYDKKNIQLTELLKKLSVNWNSFPKQFKIPVCNARFLEFDGNTQWLLAEDNNYFYEIFWTGS